jgi:hypothetical protein
MLSSHVHNKYFINSLQDIEKRLLVVLTGFLIVVVVIIITYMMRIRNSDRFTASLMTYLGCIQFKQRDECPQYFREHVPTGLTITADFMWPCFFLFIMVFLLSYKDVRQLWFQILTCGLYDTKPKSTKSTDADRSDRATETAMKTSQTNTSTV